MQRSHVARDVLDIVRSCLPPEICDQYKFFRSRGLPPARCQSITTSWDDARPLPAFGDCDPLMDAGACGGWEKRAKLRVVLTRICPGPDQSDPFNWELEDTEAACFDDHLDLIEECLLCHDWRTFRTDHGIAEMQLDGETHDVETEGGAFSSYIELTLLAKECCS